MKFNSETIDTLKAIWTEFSVTISGEFTYNEIITPYVDSVTYKYEIQKQTEPNIRINKSFISQIRLNPIEKPLLFSTRLESRYLEDLFIRKFDFMERFFKKKNDYTANAVINKTFLLDSHDTDLIRKLFIDKHISDYFIEYNPELIINSKGSDNYIEMRIYNSIDLELFSDSYRIFNLILNIVKL